jgi:hypothetical protein
MKGKAMKQSCPTVERKGGAQRRMIEYEVSLAEV